MRPEDSIGLGRRLDRALHGDRLALADLVRAETPRLHGIAWRITGDAALAEDVVQEVFLRIIERRSPVRRKGAAAAWLGRVAVHAAIDVLRRRRARERREEVHAMGAAARQEEARDLVADEEEGRLIAEGFGALPVDVRAAVWLTVVEGDSIRRVANEIGQPVTTLYRRVHEGLEELRKFLASRGVTAALALPLADVLCRMPAPPVPEGLAARVLERIADAAASVTASTAGGVAGGIVEKGAMGMAAVSAKKIGIVIAMLLLLGGGVFIVDPFHLNGWRETEIASAPAATPAAAADDATPSPAPAADAPLAEDRAPVDPTGSILVRAVWKDDRLPVPGLLACVARSSDLRRETTDEKGEARFARVREGGVWVYLQRGNTTFGNSEVVVKAGRESEVTIDVPPGVEIEGVVVDGDGKPVPAASIWLTEYHNAFQGTAVAAAGPDGKFRMRHVELGRYVGARAPGYAPSLLQSIEGRPTSVVPIRLVLDQPGVAVNGVVLDPGGSPAADAVLKIEKPSRGLLWTRDGTEVRSPALSARTGADGAFAFDCVAVGDLTLTVRSEGLVPFEAPLSVPEEGLSDLRIDLEEGVTVAGTVWTPEGEPARGALVVVGVSDSNQAHLSGDLITIATSAGQDGSYRLAGVQPGEFEVRADGHGKGKASARFTGQAGEAVRWDARLSLGLEILGHVVDENGKPVEKALVGAEGKGCVHTWIWTDREGRFRFSNCKEVPHKLSVSTGNSPASAEQDEVMPGKGEVALVLRAAARPSAFLIGTVLDPDARPAETAHLVMLGLETVYPQKDGSFRIGPLPPGRCRLEVRLGEHPHVSRECELVTNETADLGTIQVHRGGRLQARLRKPDGTPCPCSVRVVSEAGDPELEMKYSSDWVASSELAAPGDYGILVWRRGLASTWVPVRIEDGQTAAAEVVIREGVERAFRLLSSEGKSGESTHVIVRGEDGNKVFDWRVQPHSGWQPSSDGAGRTLDLVVWLAPGMSYTAEASARGRRAQASFAVAGAAETADPLVLDVR